MPIELRSNNARAVILLEYGGRLHQLFVPFEGREEPLLYGPREVEAYRERPTRGGSFPHGAMAEPGCRCH
jgi:galactose mutarotase-like enzyme